jgi:hypothetical protein
VGVCVLVAPWGGQKHPKQKQISGVFWWFMFVGFCKLLQNTKSKKLRVRTAHKRRFFGVFFGRPPLVLGRPLSEHSMGQITPNTQVCAWASGRARSFFFGAAACAGAVVAFFNLASTRRWQSQQIK